MLITLFTDASYCMKTHVAAYAAWAKTDRCTVRRAGVLKETVPDSSVAEAQALVNGLCIALAVLKPGADSRIIAQTDCLAAIAALTGEQICAKQKTMARFALRGRSVPKPASPRPASPSSSVMSPPTRESSRHATR